MSEVISRREFSKSALSALATASALPAIVNACATVATSRTLPPLAPLEPSRQAELDGDEFRAWREIDRLARLAPTPHNTQPFRIRPRDGTTAEIVAVPDRFLPEEDHGNRYVTSAFGIMAETIELAARTIGLRVRVTAVESVNVADLHRAADMPVLGTAVIQPVILSEVKDLLGENNRILRLGQDDILGLRRTSRIPYHDRLIAPEVWETLRADVESHGHRLLETHDPEVVEATLRLNANSIIDNLAFAPERKEIQRWYRTGPTPQFGDGLWEIPLNQKVFHIRTAFGSPRAYRLPIIRPLAIREYLKTQRGTRHIALLRGPFRTWPELVAAGRALFRMWTDMARLGVHIQPMGSMLTNAKYAAIVAERFGVNDCWLIMRAGYSDLPPRAPRLETILI